MVLLKRREKQQQQISKFTTNHLNTKGVQFAEALQSSYLRKIPKLGRYSSGQLIVLQIPKIFEEAKEHQKTHCLSNTINHKIGRGRNATVVEAK